LESRSGSCQRGRRECEGNNSGDRQLHDGSTIVWVGGRITEDCVENKGCARGVRIWNY
jgi:hypothetical protein